jgi:hypothetical protein
LPAGGRGDEEELTKEKVNPECHQEQARDRGGDWSVREYPDLGAKAPKSLSIHWLLWTFIVCNANVSGSLWIVEKGFLMLNNVLYIIQDLDLFHIL